MLVSDVQCSNSALSHITQCSSLQVHSFPSFISPIPPLYFNILNIFSSKLLYKLIRWQIKWLRFVLQYFVIHPIYISINYGRWFLVSFCCYFVICKSITFVREFVWLLLFSTLCFYEEFITCCDCRRSHRYFVTRISGLKDIVVLLRREYNIYGN